MIFEQFHFIRPYFLGFLVLTFWFCWYLYKKSKNTNAWTNVCDPNLLSYLLVGSDKKTGYMPVWLALLVGVLFTVALAGPTWTKLPQAVYKKELARVFVLDLSRSMDATDIMPSRASRAKLKLIDLLVANKEGQSALVAYAAQAHVVSPLTDDADTIVAMVPSLSPSIMPVQGSRTDLAILKAAQLLTQAGNHGGEIILISDGANGQSVIESAKQVSANGYSLNIIGVGTVQGAPIPIEQGGFLKDKLGAIVIPKLERSNLQELALAGSGRYIDITVDDRDVAEIIRDTLGTDIAMDNPLTREVDLWQDEGHWFLLFALPFAALGFRRGWLSVIVFFVCYVPQGELYAFEWQDMWQTKDQQASKIQDPEKAAQMFENPDWKGASHYKNGNFEKAAEAFSASNSTQANYNLANALAKQGKLEEAIDAYDNILKNDVDHEDAKFNRVLVEEALKNQKQKPAGDDKKEGEDGEEKSDQQKESEKQQSSSDESDSEQNKDQSESESQSGQDSEEEKKKAEQQQADNNEENKDKDKDKDKEKSNQEEVAQEPKDAHPEDKEKSEQEEKQQKEIQQATQQWLRRIPDDPGGLLREKFSRQYQRQKHKQQTENPW